MKDNQKLSRARAAFATAAILNIPTTFFLIILFSLKSVREALDLDGNSVWGILAFHNSPPSVLSTMLVILGLGVWTLIFRCLFRILPDRIIHSLLPKTSSNHAERIVVLLPIVTAILGVIAIACSELSYHGIWSSNGLSGLKFYPSPHLTPNANLANGFGFLCSWIAFIAGIVMRYRYPSDRASSRRFLTGAIIGGSTLLSNLAINFILRGI
ncbi:MAG: hypothetical protein KDA68_16650 [Planctomycetaceae bacterium]|nr:hypothetical protein [Planctomycetaceae bacterium]